MLKKILFLIFAATQISLFAWRDTGHMVITEIASTKLSLKSRENIKELLDVLANDYPETSDLLTASTWADDIANNLLGCSWAWHGQRKPYDPENILTDREHFFTYDQFHNFDVVFAINNSIAILKNQEAKKIEKAVALRFLLHFVGDAHMPLHCATLYNKNFPEGDWCGCKFKIKGNLVDKNDLHSLWDSIIGIDNKRFEKPLNFINHEAIISLAYNIMRDYPSLEEANDLNPSDWADESYQLAIDVAYKDIEPNTIPSEEYIQKSRKCACKRIALAGYRLANLLNEIFDKDI